MPRSISEETKLKMAEGRRLAKERRLQLKMEASIPDEDIDERLEALARQDVAEPFKLKTAADDLWDGLLTDEEKAELDAAAAKKAREDQRKAVRAAYAKDALERERNRIGATPVDEQHRKFMEEEVRLYIDMPRLRKPGGGEHAPEPIILDQTAYVSGRYYPMPRARAIYCMWLMDQARRHVNAIDGRSRSYYNSEIHQMVHQGGVAAGGGMLGPGFEAIHKRPN